MGSLLRMLEKLLGRVAKASEGNPKTASFYGMLSLLGSGWALLGFNPLVVHQIGEMMIRFGGLLVKF